MQCSIQLKVEIDAKHTFIIYLLGLRTTTNFVACSWPRPACLIYFKQQCDLALSACVFSSTVVSSRSGLNMSHVLITPFFHVLSQSFILQVFLCLTLYVYVRYCEVCSNVPCAKCLIFIISRNQLYQISLVRVSPYFSVKDTTV